MKLTHASLFSGFGAPDIAAQWMGWDNAFHCEINEFCNTILNYWFPDSKTYKDVTATDFTEWRGKIHVLTGGFPCQPFSVAGQRKGADDNRYLWPHMLRAIREIRPDWIIGENVGGILTMVQPSEEVEVGYQPFLFEEDNKETILEQEFVVETICQDLEHEGYSVQPFLIPACAVGAPHRRDRVWFVAHCDSARFQKERFQQQATRSAGIDTSTISHTDSERHSSLRPYKEPERVRSRNDGQQKEREQSSQWIDGFHRLLRDASDSDGQRCYGGSNNRGERSDCDNRERKTAQNKSERPKRECRSGKTDSIDVYADCDRLEGRSYQKKKRISEQFPEKPGTCGLRNWQDFPTQSPICRGNDGIPFDVVRLTIPFSKWRQESVKGYGNAIVPQVIFEIFKAIEQVEQQY